MTEPLRKNLYFGLLGIAISFVIAFFPIWSLVFLGFFREDDQGLNFIICCFLCPPLGLIMLGFSYYYLIKFKNQSHPILSITK